jgi:hypothetical protein
MDAFCPIIRIDKSFKPTHLQNNYLILNVWSRSSQKLGLRIDNNGSRSSCSPNHRKFGVAVVGMANLLRVCEHWIFWTPITMKCGSTLGTNFFTQLSSRSEGFLLPLSTTTMVLEGSMLANVGFLGDL